MYKRYSENFKRDMVVIYPGEFYVSSHDIIATVLGSCISVCIKDKKTGIAGMNHFMLPGDVRSEDMFLSASAKYGMFAMEQLINEMIKRNGSKRDFEAKVFGGGHVLNFRKTDGNVPESNIEFVRAFLNMEQICGDSKIIKAEESYKTKLFKEKEKLQEAGGDLTLF